MDLSNPALQHDLDNLFDSILIADPGNFYAIYGKAMILCSNGRLSECLDLLNKAIKLHSVGFNGQEIQLNNVVELQSKETLRTDVLPNCASFEPPAPDSENIQTPPRDSVNMKKPTPVYKKVQEPAADSAIIHRPAQDPKIVQQSETDCANSESVVKKKDFTCSECAKVFSSQYSLKRHTLLHTGDRPWKCNLCGKAFIQKKDCERHLTVHSDEHNFGCPDCHKCFKTQKNLRSHMKLHSSERPFKCDICAKEFKVKRFLKAHERIHKDKQFKCKVCGKDFIDKIYLKSHMTVHVDERPFACMFCGFAFKRKHDLVYHNNSQHFGGLKKITG